MPCKAEINPEFSDLDDPSSLEVNIRLIEKLTSDFQFRAMAAGIPLERDDIRQEVMLSWVKSARDFDPTKGRFSTLFVMIARRRMNRLFDAIRKGSTELGITSTTRQGPEGEFQITDMMPDGRPSPELEVMAEEHYRNLYRRLSPCAKVVINWIHSPPEFLLIELKKRNKKVELGRSLGLELRAQTSVTVALATEVLVKVLNLSESRRSRIKSELSAITKFL